VIKINERTYVAAQHIKSISKPEGYDYVRVTMFDGETHTVEPVADASVDELLIELVNAVRGIA
jgi:hypothetical protein